MNYEDGLPAEWFVFLGSYYHLFQDIESVEDLTIEEIDAFIQGTKLLEYRRVYPFALMISTVLNAMGGRGDGKGKRIPPHQLYKPEEFLPPWANPYLEQIDPFVAREILTHIQQEYFPTWTISLLPSEAELKHFANH